MSWAAQRPACLLGDRHPTDQPLAGLVDEAACAVSLAAARQSAMGIQPALPGDTNAGCTAKQPRV